MDDPLTPHEETIKLLCRYIMIKEAEKFESHHISVFHKFLEEYKVGKTI